jgi:hypothetical protein
MFSMIFEDQHQFTGFEHTRIIDLLTLLAIISVVMWLIVMLLIVVRHIAIYWYSHAKRVRYQQPAVIKKSGGSDER